MNGRLEWLIDNYQKLVPDEVVNSDTMIRGTSLEKLAAYDGPPFRRIHDWITKKLFETEHQGQNNSIDMALAEVWYQNCFELMKGRNQKYGDSWKVLSVQSIANLIEMKMHRIANMDTKNLDPKIKDELIDTVNYGIFGLIKLAELEGIPNED